MATCPTETQGRPAALGSIAEQTVDHNVDVLLGGGKAALRPDRHRRAVRRARPWSQQAQAQGYNVVTDQAGLDAAPRRHASSSACSRRATWTSSGPARWPRRTRAPAATALHRVEPGPAGHRAAPGRHDGQGDRPAVDARPSGDQRKGFFLQVEGASIDKQDHAANPCGQIGETVEFDQAIQVALDFAKQHPDTLVIVTADHGHTSQIVEPQTAPTTARAPSPRSSPTTAQPMVVNYATNLDGRSQSHTGTEVRIAAQGPQAANVARASPTRPTCSTP